MFEVVFLTVLIALVFCFSSGFQDANTVAATFIASRSAAPRQGIILVAFFNVAGALLGGSAVVFTISGILLAPSGGEETVSLILSGILAATAWNLVTWWRGLPSSSTHALIGGLIGAGIAGGGVRSINWGMCDPLSGSPRVDGVCMILLFLVGSVLLGLFSGYTMRCLTRLALRNARRRQNRTIIRLNWCAAAFMAFSNGANDSQKPLGVIVLVLFSAGLIPVLSVPLFARILCAALLLAGTLIGGWRIMRTLGYGILRLEPIHSFDSQFSSALIISGSTLLGAPVSSSHVVSTSVIGIGVAENPKKVHWQVGREILVVMALTIPATLLIAWATASLLLSLGV